MGCTSSRFVASSQTSEGSDDVLVDTGQGWRVDLWKGFNGNISGHAFYNCISLNCTNVPSAEKSVGKRRFHGFNQLTEVDLPEGVEEIQDEAFLDCMFLTRVKIPPTVKMIGVESFRDCYRLVEVDLSEGLERIAEGAFLGCLSLKRIQIPSTVKEVPEYGFTNCKQLEEAEIHEGVREISKHAFRNCKLLKSITIPPTVKVIGEGAFAGCDQLETVVLREGLEEIGSHTFFDCRSLRHVKIPSTVKVVDAWAFGFCKQLEEVELCEGVEHIKCHVFHHCKVLKGVKIPSTVKVIGEQAFYKCKQLKKVEYREGLEKIESSAFFDCRSLKSIRFPSTVKVISAEAFFNCNQLVSVELCSGIMKVEQSSFAYCPSLRNVVVPDVSTCCFEGCTDLLKLFGSEIMIRHSLWDRFYGLPIHTLCYYQSNLPPKMVVQQEESSMHNGMLPSMFKLTKKRHDCLGMTPLHILACSTEQNHDLYLFAVDLQPESLITEDKWGCPPILYALWCEAPQPIIQFLISSQKSAFGSHVLNWDKMVETLCRNGASLDIIKMVFEIKQTFFSGHSINWQKAAQELTIHSLVTCVPFEDHPSISWGPMLEVFGAHQEIAQSLLEIKQSCFRDPTDINWQLVCEELVRPLEGWWQTSISVSMETFCFLIKNNIADRLRTIGVKKWRLDVIDSVKEISRVSRSGWALKNYFNAVQSKLAHYEHEYHEVKDAIALLELAVWKSKINQSCRSDDHTVDIKAKLRINCGVDVIVPNVLPFLKYWDVAFDVVKTRMRRRGLCPIY